VLLGSCDSVKGNGNVKAKVLIVDDNSILRKTARTILKSRFPTLRVFEAENGKEAFNQIHDHVPDLILMDIGLPHENGIKLTRKIKDLYPNIVVAIFTNYDLPEYREAAFAQGADFFFSKTSENRRRLSTIVQSALAHAGFHQL
jgi:DNA-binding NarL/FixJ family response regulator